MKRLLPHFFLLLLTLAAVCPRQAMSAVDREQEIRDAVTAFITSRTAGMKYDISIRRITFPEHLKFPEGIIDYEIGPLPGWEGWGKISIPVIARQKDRILHNITAWAEVAALTDMVVTLRQIDYGTSITAADLVLQKREITPNSQHAARAINDVTGKKARTTLRANQPVRADQVEKIPLVKSGQMVTIKGENRVIKISASGTAHSSGAEGDIVRVRINGSQKEIEATVIDASTVQVTF